MEKKDKKNLSFISDDFLKKSSENLNLDTKNLNYIYLKHCIGINTFNNIINKELLNNLNKKPLLDTNLIQDDWIIIDEK